MSDNKCECGQPAVYMILAKRVTDNGESVPMLTNMPHMLGARFAACVKHLSRGVEYVWQQVPTNLRDEALIQVRGEDW